MENVLRLLRMKLMHQDRIEQCYDEYSLLKTDEERVKLSMNIFHEFEMSPKMKLATKDSKVSVEFRNEANKLYTLGNLSYQLDKVIELYTKSIAYAPADSEELAITYANRSAALFHGRLYDESLKDIDRALSLKYPDHLKAKLFTRKAQCLVVTGASTSEFEKAVQEARNWLEKMEKNNQGRKLIEKILDSPIKKDNFPKQKILLDDERDVPTLPDENPEIPGASSAVEIKYSEEFGRHVVAARDIEPGEVIAVQKAYSSILLIEKNYTNCSNCLRQTWSGIPCNFCVEIIYCSEKCRQEAWEDHHDLECQLMGLVITYEIPFLALLGVRMSIRAIKEAGSIEELQKLVKIINSHQDPRTKGFTNNIFDDRKYSSVYSLVTNTTKRSAADLFTKSTTSAYLTFMLAIKNPSLFGNELEQNFQVLSENPLVTFVGGLILRHLQIIPSNAHSVIEGTDEIMERGGALMPFFSLYNHSCNPTCSRNSFGRTMIQITTNFIKKGSQIFDNYGVNFALYEKYERQRQLKEQYLFDCQCIACTENWPVLSNLPRVEYMSLPHKKKVAALAKTQKLFDHYRTVFENKIDDREEILKDLREISKYYEKNIPLPFREMNIAIETFKQIFILRSNLIQSLN